MSTTEFKLTVPMKLLFA